MLAIETQILQIDLYIVVLCFVSFQKKSSGWTKHLRSKKVDGWMSEWEATLRIAYSNQKSRTKGD